MERTRLFCFAHVLVAVVVAPAQTPPTEIVLHHFGCPPKGANPAAGVIRDPAGNFYGTTSDGGAANHGVVYKLDTTGQETVLYSFTGGADGGNPQAGVIRDSAGNLYGTTVNGGTANAGVVYKLDTTGQQTVLYSFTGGTDGGGPNAGMIRDQAGNLYGTTDLGGAMNQGAVFKLDTAGHETVLYNFTGGTDGGYPAAGVVRDSAGNFYGTTFSGGTANSGVVYKLDTAGHETVLYSFTGGADGSHPNAEVIRDSAGNLYGTTYLGGASFFGVVYKLDTNGHETVLVDVSSVGGLFRDSAGNLYGTTPYGGTGGSGVVYKLDASGHETVLYNFSGGIDGRFPRAGVIRDSAGNLYGTTTAGGTAGVGVVYKLDTAGHETALYSFAGGSDGFNPTVGVIRDSTGNLYGTTSSGGPAGVGVVYKLDAAGHETVLHSFTGGDDGAYPYAGVIRDDAGNLYGTTSGGGTSNWGVVYKLDPTGRQKVLYSFTGGADGGYPYAGVIRDSVGNLYGTTQGGGTADAGVVYKLDTSGRETVLYSFTGGADGFSPNAGVIRDSAGNLYGTTCDGGKAYAGVVYKLDTAGHLKVLYAFTLGADGGLPYAGVIRDSAGNLYGTTTAGGAANHGVVYKLDTTGHETVLYNFLGANLAGVISDSAGNLYGTTLGPGTDEGVVYKLDTTGQESVLYSFKGGADGALPWAGVIRDSAGNLYGTTYGGGKRSTGVVFKIKP